MEIIKTSIDKIRKLRTEYLNSLPEFQELFIELMIEDSDYYNIQAENKDIGYAVRNNEGDLIEFYVTYKYIPESDVIFRQILKELSIMFIYCKSFDYLLLGNCLINSLPYSVLGILYRDYVEPLIEKDPDIKMKKSGLSSVGLLLEQDASINELFETERQLTDFIQTGNVFEFYKDDEFIGCGMVLRTHPDWNYCDLGVWVKPLHRGNSYGSQIISGLREFAIKNSMIPSCGCAIENKASQRTIEKSGFVSRHKLIKFHRHIRNNS